MSRLPQPGDAVLASRALNGRVDAAVGANEDNPIVRMGGIVLTEDGITGPGVPVLLSVYGDLFDVTETLDDAGWAGLLSAHERDIEAGEDTLDSTLIAVALQAVAFGVLMERLRWERNR